MNVFCLGARVTGASLALELIDIFLNAKFSGATRHQRRLAKFMRWRAKRCRRRDSGKFSSPAISIEQLDLGLRALGSPKTAILYSLDSMTTRGALGVLLQPHWQMIGALEAANGMLLFGISTSFIFTVMLLYYQHLVFPAPMKSFTGSDENFSKFLDRKRYFGRFEAKAWRPLLKSRRATGPAFSPNVAVNAAPNAV